MKYKNLNEIRKKSIPYYNMFQKTHIETYKNFNYEKNNREINIFIQGKTKTYISSLDHKEFESKLLINEIVSGEYDEIVVFGVGNAVFFEKLVQTIDREIKLHIIEFQEVMDIIINNNDLKKIDFSKIDNMALIERKSELKSFFYKLLSKSNMNIKMFVLPQYERLFNEEVTAMYNDFKEIVSNKRNGIRVNSNYQKLWIYNSIINLKHVLETPNFFDLEKLNLSNSVAILVGAGPSLSMDIELIKELSEKGNCYIFAVGSAYKALVNKGIRMDAIFSYDPTHLNEDVLNEYYEKNVDAPICFGSTIGFKSIRKVNYMNSFHVVTSQDYFGQYLLQGTDIPVVLDAPSVVVIALQSLVRIGFKNIIFAGQNLSYLDGKNYSEGIYYKRLEGATYNSTSTIKDVFGNDVFTMSGYELTLQVIENFIRANKNIEFINTTFGGAAIEGAPYKPLKEIAFDNFDEVQNLIEKISSNKYDLPEIEKRFDSLLKERADFLKLLSEGFGIIFDIKKKHEAKQLTNMDLMVSLEKKYNQMSKNLYFNVLLSKLDRNYLNIFESSIVEINRELDLYKKYDLALNKMATLFNLFKNEDQNVYKLFKYISKYIKWE